KPALIDAKTGSLTAMRDMPWYLKAIFISQPFHFGDYGGMPMKVMWALFDLLTIVVLISGWYLGVPRRKPKAIQAKRAVEDAESLTLLTTVEDGESEEYMDRAMGHACICWGRYINGPIAGYYGDRIYLARNVVDNAGHSAVPCGE